MQVRPGPSASLLPKRVVTFNKVSAVFSSFFLLNLASMPLKAYMTESLPWVRRMGSRIHITPSANESFAAFEQRALAHYTIRYTLDAHLNGSNYFYDAVDDVDVLCGPLQRMTNASFSFVNLPGAFFYSKRARLWIREASLGNRNASTTALVQPSTLMSLPVSLAVIWIDSYDNVFFAVQLYHGSSAWLYCKFAFRIGMTLRILYLLWTSYYVYYRALVTQLRRYGTCGVSERLEIIVGDPTSLILQNTSICLFFVIDFWCSLEVAGQCFVRIDQTTDLWTFGLATLYLSRTVWFGYLVLNLSGRVLRRSALESRCAQADPTSVAIAVALVVGPMTFCQVRLSFLIEMYHTLFTFVLPKSRQMNDLESALPAILYTLVLGMLPLVYSFLAPMFRHVTNRVHSLVWVPSTLSMVGSSKQRLSLVMRRSSLALLAVDGGAFGRLNYNDWKHRLLLAVIFGCCCCGQTQRRLPKAFKGGSIYKLFTTHRHLQRNAAFSFRGSDCYVLSHRPDTIISHRLSLCDALHLKHRTDVVLGICPGRAFGRLIMNPDRTIGVHFGAAQSRWIL